MRLMDLTGQSFGRLRVIGRAENRGTVVCWRCVCECGTEAVVRSQVLRRGETASCGCLRKQVLADLRRTHGHYNSRTYRSYRSMLQRCSDPNMKCWPDYGGRGITVCTRWLESFENFLADMGERPPSMSLDRINVNGNYEPSNCRWATALEQRHNRRDSV